MATQEVMLNDNVNLNLQYGNRVFKIKVNIRNGLILIGELHDNGDNLNTLRVIDLNTVASKTYEAEAKEVKEEVQVIEDKGEENLNGRSSKSKRRKNKKNK